MFKTSFALINLTRKIVIAHRLQHCTVSLNRHRETESMAYLRNLGQCCVSALTVEYCRSMYIAPPTPVLPTALDHPHSLWWPLQSNGQSECQSMSEAIKPSEERRSFCRKWRWDVRLFTSLSSKPFPISPSVSGFGERNESSSLSKLYHRGKRGLHSKKKLHFYELCDKLMHSQCAMCVLYATAFPAEKQWQGHRLRFFPTTQQARPVA